VFLDLSEDGLGGGREGGREGEEGGREGEEGGRAYLGQVLEDGLDVAVFLDLGEGGLGTDAADGDGVVAAHQDAEVDKLSRSQLEAFQHLYLRFLGFIYFIY